MTYYLCGPIDTAGQKEKNIEAFKSAAERLREERYEILSPIEENNPESCESYQEFLKKDLEILFKCNAIILLPGWCYSNGATQEFNIAAKLGFEVYFYCPNEHSLLIDMGFIR